MAQLVAISLGAGVQSTTMALMAAHGEIEPMPDCAIFADTGWEPKAVYQHLAWLRSPNVLPFPVHVVAAGNLRDDLIARSSARSGRFITVPFFLKHPNGDEGIGRRQCTSHYKIEPIRKKVRELVGRPKGPVPAGAVEKWIGISMDEAIRMKPSNVRFEVNRWPLIEKRMSRNDCFAWLARNGYPVVRPGPAGELQQQWPPKSSCLGCPYHSAAMWRELHDTSPEEWADTVEVDKAIRTPLDRLGTPTLRGQQFMHRQRVPLDQVDLSTAEDRGQLNLFINECEGMCGV